MTNKDFETTYRIVRSPTHRLTECPCPTCGKPLDAATGGSQGNGPKPGDLTVCFYCTSFLTFTQAGVRLLSAEEIGELPDENRIDLMRARRSLKAFWRKKKHAPA